MNFKFTVELCVMKMKNQTKIEEELICRFKIDMNFTKFEPNTQKVLFFLIGSLWPKYILLQLYANFEERSTSGLKFGKFSPEHLKVSKLEL